MEFVVWLLLWIGFYLVMCFVHKPQKSYPVVWQPEQSPPETKTTDAPPPQDTEPPNQAQGPNLSF